MLGGSLLLHLMEIIIRTPVPFCLCVPCVKMIMPTVLCFHDVCPQGLSCTHAFPLPPDKSRRLALLFQMHGSWLIILDLADVNNGIKVIGRLLLRIPVFDHALFRRDDRLCRKDVRAISLWTVFPNRNQVDELTVRLRVMCHQHATLVRTWTFKEKPWTLQLRLSKDGRRTGGNGCFCATMSRHMCLCATLIT